MSSKALTFFYLILLTTFPAQAEWVRISVVCDKAVIGEASVDIENNIVTHINGPELLPLVSPYLIDETIQALESLVQNNSSISIENLNKLNISTQFFEKSLELVLTLTPELRSLKSLPLGFKRSQAGLLTYDKPYSGYFNYSVLAGFTSDAQINPSVNSNDPKQGFFELVQNFNYFTFETTAEYKEFEAKPLQRADTALVHDFEKSQIRLRLGDFFAKSQGFQSSLNSAGIQIQKQFSIYPERGSLSKRSAVIQVKQNSLMEVYVNDVFLNRFRVRTGPYNLNDIPMLYGRNKVKVILIDDFGGKDQFEVDLFYDEQILAKGVHNFSYQLGAPSYYIENEKHYYPSQIGSFFHQYGINDRLTVSTQYQNYKTSRLLSTGFGFLSDIGTNTLEYAYYTDDLVNASNAHKWNYSSPNISYKYISDFRLLIATELKTREFKSISAIAPIPSTYSEKIDLILQKNFGFHTSASLGVGKITGQNGSPNDLSRRLGFQSQFIRNWIFDFTYNWTQQQTNTDQILLSLTWIEPKGKTLASLLYTPTNNSTSVRFNKNNLQPYEDYRLSLAATLQEPKNAARNQHWDTSHEYFARSFETRLRLYGNNNLQGTKSTLQLGLGSAIAWTADGFAISRRISDSFAIVSPKGLSKESNLTIPNGPEQKTLSLINNENFVFSNLSAYQTNYLQLNSTELKAGYRLDRESYLLLPSYRSGVFIKLDIQKSVILTGKLNSEASEWTKYAYGKIWNSIGELQVSPFFTDDNGFFVVEGLSTGQYEIELSDPRLKRIPIEVKDTEGTEIDLGTINLEKKEGT
jgi:outer membrane usher protein